MLGRRREPVEPRFWTRVRVVASTDCWEWQAGRIPTGYGAIRVNGQQTLAHRLSYEWHHGAIPEGLCVLHRCDNRRCVNPHHLFLGTKGDNNRDTAQKGRHATKKKLTPDDVRHIRRLYAAGGTPQRDIASLFGISQVQVGHIVRRAQWAGVE